MLLFFHYSADLPSVDGLKHYQPPALSQVYAGNFQLVAELASERRLYVPYAQIPRIVQDAFISAEDRDFWINPGIDPFAIVRAAFTDIFRLARGQRPLGASTITQQLARNMLLTNQLSLGRKIREAILAIRLDRTLSKQRILEIYLNQIYLGEQSYGIGAAAQAYFDKPLDRLDLAQTAMLAALPKAPSYYDPFIHPHAALIRRNWVLDRMVENGYLTRQEAAQAKAEPILPKAAPPPHLVPEAGYFADAVRQELIARFGKTKATAGGLVVETSLDPKLEAAATAAVRTGVIGYDQTLEGWRGPLAHLPRTDLAGSWQAALDHIKPPAGMLRSWRLAVVLSVTPAAAKVGWVSAAALGLARFANVTFADTDWARWAVKGGLGPFPRSMGDILAPGDVVMVQPMPSAGQKGGERALLRQIPKIEGALISLDAASGRVLAMVGGWSYRMSQFNRVTEAHRQPGSAFKPMVYLAAMQENIPPDAIVLDAPFVINLGAAGEYRPGDYEEDFLGPIPVHEALEESRNLATLHLAEEVGLKAIARNATAFGVVDKMPLIYPAAIGALNTTMMRMVAAYASLDEGGLKVVPTLIDSVADRTGRIIYRAPALSCPNCTQGPDEQPKLVVSRRRIADAASVFQVVTMMRGVIARGTGVPAGVGFDRPLAGKTGTSESFRDAWFIGFSHDIVTACWVGYDTPRSLGTNETGGNLCGPIWNRFMKVALAGRPKLDFSVPPGMVLAPTSTGGQPPIVEAFKPGQIPGAGGAAVAATVSAPEAGQAVPGPVRPARPLAPIDNQMGGLY